MEAAGVGVFARERRALPLAAPLTVHLVEERDDLG